jgi:hypothetical protein
MGGVPFGFRREGKTLVVVPEQAEAVRWAAEAVLDGWALTNIARKLTRDGHRGAKGGHISAPAVRRLLTAPTLAGKLVRGGEIVGAGNWAPILQEDLWQEVRAKLASPRTIRTADGNERQVDAAVLGVRPGRKYLLTSGLARCGVCTAPLTGLMKKANRGITKPYYQCLQRTEGRGCVAIVLTPTEEYVRDQLLDELDKPEFLGAVTADDYAERRDELTCALSALDRQRAELAEMWGAGGMSTSEWQAARSGLDQREHTLHTELATIPVPIARIAIGDVRTAWPAMTLDERRELLRIFIQRVTVNRATPGTRRFDPDRIEIEWRTL